MKEPPKITKRTVYIKSTLFSFKDCILRISLEPSKLYLKVDLRRYNWIPKDFDRVGGLILTEKELIISVKKSVEPKADRWASFDVNLMNVTSSINGEIKRYDLKELYPIHRGYEVKRQRVQKLSKFKSKTSRRLLAKYSGREKNRVKAFMDKLTIGIVRELEEVRSEAILEDLKNIKENF